jgi:hypothetical protein
MKKLAGILVLAPLLLPATSQAGTQCRTFGNTGYIVNWHNMIDQSKPELRQVVNLGGNLCGPAAAAHLLAGFDDFPVKPATSDAATAGFNNFDINTFGSIVRKQGLLMGTNRTLLDIDLVLTNIEVKQKGTLAWDVNAPLASSLATSFSKYGNNNAGGLVPSGYSSQYYGLFPSNFTTDTLAEPICADVILNKKPSRTDAEYDYAKTQFLMSYGYFSISELNVPYPCGDWYTLGLDKWCLSPTGLYSVVMTGGHFVSVVGGYDDGISKAIAIANPHNSLYWSGVSQITVKIAGTITLFDRAGTVYDPNPAHVNETKIVSSYTRAKVIHGQKCPSGSYLNMSTGPDRGSCMYPLN